MRTIWKYEVPPNTQNFRRVLPKGAKILTVLLQFDKAAFWAEVDPSEPDETRSFVIVGTGELLPKWELQYVGTYQLENGTNIQHLFEVISTSESPS